MRSLVAIGCLALLTSTSVRANVVGGPETIAIQAVVKRIGQASSDVSRSINPTARGGAADCVRELSTYASFADAHVNELEGLLSVEHMMVHPENEPYAVMDIAAYADRAVGFIKIDRTSINSIQATCPNVAIVTVKGQALIGLIDELVDLTEPLRAKLHLEAGQKP
jgi:hypothetical protein